MNKQKITDTVIDLINRYVEYERPELSNYHCTVYENVKNLPLDSLSRVELVMELEDIFGIDIRDEDIERCMTVNDVIDYILKERGELLEEIKNPTRFEVITQDAHILAQAIYDKYRVSDAKTIENWLKEEVH